MKRALLIVTTAALCLSGAAGGSEQDTLGIVGCSSSHHTRALGTDTTEEKRFELKARMNDANRLGALAKLVRCVLVMCHKNTCRKHLEESSGFWFPGSVLQSYNAGSQLEARHVAGKGRLGVECSRLPW